MASLGQDHDAGHRSYVASLPAADQRWLRTKPFSAPPGYELPRCLHSFAHIVEALDLPPGARVLDVGCGPGWISEWLARCGFEVTGLDISEDMLEVARARIAALGDAEMGDAEARASFLAQPVQRLDMENYFDAAILFDAMHHFDDEATTLDAIARCLVPGGRIYIHEGERPAPGSPGERELIEEMERYGTLEAPFDGDYLVQAVERAGFVGIRRLAEIDRLVKSGGGSLRTAIGLALEARRPGTNTIIAATPPGDGRGLRAELDADTVQLDGGALVIALAITNTGTERWSTAASDILLPGAVNVAPFTAGDDGSRRELARVALPRPVAPGERLGLELRIPRAEIPGDRLGIDLVRERVAWFGDRGGSPLWIEVPA